MTLLRRLRRAVHLCHDYGERATPFAILFVWPLTGDDTPPFWLERR